MFQVIFFDEKRGEYECIAVAHHQDTAPLQTGPLKQYIHNKSAQLRFKALLAASFLSAVRF